MMRAKQFVFKTAAVILLALGVLMPLTLQHAAAQTGADQVCAGIATASGGGCTGSNKSLNKIVGVAVNILSTIIGIAAVIMIMVGGFKYITAGGDASKIGAAKSTIIYAIIGLVIVGLAQAVVKFVLQNVK